MTPTNRKAYLQPDHRIEIERQDPPQPARDEVLVKIAANGICGSDLHFYSTGRLGNYVVERSYVPGHEASGVVQAAGPDVRGVTVGARVVVEPGVPCGRCGRCKEGRYNLCPNVYFLSEPHNDGTFCDYVTLRADCVHEMPDGMSFEQGALAEPVAVAVHAVNRAGITPGSTAAVLGCGPIGLLTLQAFRAAGGAHVLGVDTMESRRRAACELGARDAVSPQDASGAVADGVDVVFETAGSSRATAAAFGLARTGATVVQVGWPETDPVALSVAGLLEKELTYVGVNRYANAFGPALAWMADGSIRTDPLVTHRFEFDRVDEAFRFAIAHRDEVIKVVVTN